MKRTYADSGVDRLRSEQALRAIAPFVKGMGDFAGSFPLDGKTTLVASADGVGTKLRIAIEACRYDTIGIDLVAMNVNDVLCKGARPLFFLDSIAAPRLDPEVIRQLVEGMHKGCEEAGCVLLGGETAELPGGDYELAGFAVGIVDNDKALGAQRVQAGDKVIGLFSNGIHSNGLSLAREFITDRDLLLAPTRIYVKAVTPFFDRTHAIAHITGGGILHNTARVLPDGLKCEIDWSAWERPAIFKEIGRHVEEEEMRRTFNLGIGMILIVPEEFAMADSSVIGRITR